MHLYYIFRQAQTFSHRNYLLQPEQVFSLQLNFLWVGLFFARAVLAAYRPIYTISERETRQACRGLVARRWPLAHFGQK